MDKSSYNISLELRKKYVTAMQKFRLTNLVKLWGIQRLFGQVPPNSGHASATVALQKKFSDIFAKWFIQNFKILGFRRVLFRPYLTQAVVVVIANLVSQSFIAGVPAKSDKDGQLLCGGHLVSTDRFHQFGEVWGRAMRICSVFSLVFYCDA